MSDRISPQVAGELYSKTCGLLSIAPWKGGAWLVVEDAQGMCSIGLCENELDQAIETLMRIRTANGVSSMGPYPPHHAEPSWVGASCMPGMPKAWYWAEFPASWVFYAPERNACLCIDHGDLRWHPLMSGRYWGPWTSPDLLPVSKGADHGQ